MRIFHSFHCIPAVDRRVEVMNQAKTIKRIKLLFLLCLAATLAFSLMVASRSTTEAVSSVAVGHKTDAKSQAQMPRRRSRLEQEEHDDARRHAVGRGAL